MICCHPLTETTPVCVARVPVCPKRYMGINVLAFMSSSLDNGRRRRRRGESIGADRRVCHRGTPKPFLLDTTRRGRRHGRTRTPQSGTEGRTDFCPGRSCVSACVRRFLGALYFGSWGLLPTGGQGKQTVLVVNGDRTGEPGWGTQDGRRFAMPKSNHGAL